MKYDKNHVSNFHLSSFQNSTAYRFANSKIYLMCVTRHKYQLAINRFEYDLYPALEYAVEAVNTRDENGITNELFIIAVNNLQRELHSLQLFEKKLIFPAVLSLFDERNSNGFSPDLPSILNLCAAKEQRLGRYATEIKTMLEEKEESEPSVACDPSFLRLQQLSDIFSNRFMPERHHWHHLLMQLENTILRTAVNKHIG